MVKDIRSRTKLIKLLNPEPLPLLPPSKGTRTPQAQLQHVLGPNTLQPPSSASSGLPSRCTKNPEQPDYESDRIWYNSVNYLAGNPDAYKRRLLACSCGCPVHLDHDWYTEIFDGTLLCPQCSQCCRCGLSGRVANRRLVSIGGYVLCYQCIQHYGEPRVNPFRPRIVEHPSRRNILRLLRRTTNLAEGAAGGTTGGHNLEPIVAPSCHLYSNLWETQRSPDRRPMLRYRAYPRPKGVIPATLDPIEQPQGFYAATRSPFAERMMCPSCKLPATGRRAHPFVVPAISAVYHRDCFCCATCRWPLSVGHREPGRHFVFCTCVPPMLWCNRLSCQRERKEHHATFTCRLEPIHPGGRAQCDLMDCPGAQRRHRQSKRRTPETLTDSVIDAEGPSHASAPSAVGTTTRQSMQRPATGKQL